MNKQKHTPGPFTIETPMGDDDPWIVEAGKQSHEWHCLAIIPAGDEEDELPRPVALANARLFAAAPDMLALLRELIDIEGPQPGTAAWAEKVRAVIARAEGEP